MMNQGVLVTKDKNALAVEAADFFVTKVVSAIQKRGRALVALSGGSTPKLLFDTLVKPEFSKKISWTDVYLFWVDERCVPADHPDSNFGMTRSHLLAHIGIPEQNVFRMIGEFEPERGGKAYEDILRTFFHRIGPPPQFDLILLGLGSDGHTASLFPGTQALEEKERWAIHNYVPSLNTHRLTLTFPVLNAAKDLLFLCQGVSKSDILSHVIGHPESKRYPAQFVVPTSGTLTWIMDEEAASKLESLKFVPIKKVP